MRTKIKVRTFKNFFLIDQKANQNRVRKKARTKIWSLARKKTLRKKVYGDCANYILNRQKGNCQENLSKGES